MERTTDIKKMMNEVEDLYRKNSETHTQLEKTKEITHQFSLDL